MGKIKLAELQKMLKKRSAEQKRSDSLKAESVSTTLYNKQLLSKSRQLTIDEKIRKQAQPGYQKVVGQDTLRGKDPAELLKNVSSYKVLKGTATRPDSARAEFPVSTLSKPKKPFEPEKDKPPLEYQVKGRKGKERYEVKAPGESWQAVDREWWEVQKKYDEERSVERKKYLNKPTGKKKHDLPDTLIIGAGYFD